MHNKAEDAALLRQIEANILEKRLCRHKEAILVAVSGGLDSMVLLHLLVRLAPRFGWPVTVAHFNHRLRGRASRSDQEFVQRVAAKFGLDCITGQADVKGLAKRNGRSIEMEARAVRHEFFVRAAKQAGAKTVALAHHEDDQVELFFLRLLRGSGSEGLSGMLWTAPSPVNSHVRLVRPLLNMPRAALEKFARQERIRYREDASNQCTEHQRNQIRHELLPLLRDKYQPALSQVITRLMDIVGRESEFIRQAVTEWRRRGTGASFDQLEAALQRRILLDEFRRQGLEADFATVERLRLSPELPVVVQPNTAVLRDKNGRIHKRDPHTSGFNATELEVRLTSNQGNVRFDGLQVSWDLTRYPAPPSPRPRRSLKTEFFDAERVGSRIRLRHWRRGDRFQPIGMAQPVKVQDLFTNRKIPREERHKLVVAEAASGEIFWIEGFRISERFKLDTRTLWRLKWTWKR